jgi:murein DD-endopeptidase MepM/ murein hydrolase activator NlpD
MNRSVLLVVIVVLLGSGAIGATRTVPGRMVTTAPWRLAPAPAVGITLDTLLLGGYAAGSFNTAVSTLASDLSESERALVGQHLDRIFADVLRNNGLGVTGRLRVAYERAVRPDGTTRSIRVLGAEVAVSGRVHTAYYYERDGRPGYFDPSGRPLDAGDWVRPLRTYRVSSSFGNQRLHPILNRVLPHTGVDLAAPMGEPVTATADGIVAVAGAQGGYGVLVELQHPSGYRTRYAHLSSMEPGVVPGSAVNRGDVIGYVGMSGLATGPHLHYEVRRRGQPVDPQQIVGTGDILSDPGVDPRWSLERKAVAALLARTPTVSQLMSAAGASGT